MLLDLPACLPRTVTPSRVDMLFSEQLHLRLLGRISRRLPLAPAQTERRCATSFGCICATASL